MNTNKTTKEKMLDRIDFLSDHWTMGDDKRPFQFGGWREEVADALVEIVEEALQQERERLAEKIKERMIKVPPTRSHNTMEDTCFNLGILEAERVLLSQPKEES